ncbi:siderophore-interacting protein [Salinisphaera sp. RV14]|uniref:siderophore-interacting protein n=1 Tax=Salinisphaera sp. RV14 TaxID=3454140 RepID=UPI003F82A941
MNRRPSPRTFTVLDKTEITPNMLRVTLGGEGMADFPADQESAYVKLRFPQAQSERPLLRTYTIRSQRDDSVDIDFVRHGDGGPAARWAEEVQRGETIDIGGPGPKKRVDSAADWVLLIGDMTALPAISANLETLPRAMSGHAIIEVLHESDIQNLDAPDGVAIQWVINPHPGADSAPLYDAVAALDWPAGAPSVWCACEFATMRRLREHLRGDRGVMRQQLYISSYWQRGSNEEAHKQNKRADAEGSASTL